MFQFPQVYSVWGGSTIGANRIPILNRPAGPCPADLGRLNYIFLKRQESGLIRLRSLFSRTSRLREKAREGGYTVSTTWVTARARKVSDPLAMRSTMERCGVRR